MSVTLRVDGDRWRSYLRSVADAHPGIVPVVKGNGYGFGIGSLARRCEWLKVPTMAVGTYEEVPDALSRFPGDVLVMSPWRPVLPDVPDDRRVIHTLGRIDDIGELGVRHPGARVVVEGVTSMARHGLTRHELAHAAVHLRRLKLEGFSIHLPIAGDRLGEAEQWAAVLAASRVDTTTLFVSHLSEPELAQLAQQRPGLDVRPRIGTALWLGDRAALKVTAHVLDRHSVSRGERIGYRGRAMPRDGQLLIVSGGTAHGIALEAPASNSSPRGRAVTFAKGGLEAAGLVLSPFTVAGKQRWFAEPPHMQASMLFLPTGVDAPEVGAEVDVNVRFTTTHVDAVHIT